MALLWFLATSMSDRRRCSRCRAFVAHRDIDAHAAEHGVRPDDIRVEPGLLA